MNDNSSNRSWQEVSGRINNERSVLEALYVEMGVAIDQLGLRPLLLVRLTDLFNEETCSDFRPGEVLRYLLLKRKNSDWIRLGSRAKLMKPLGCPLTSSELTALKVVYSRIAKPLDEYLVVIELVDILSSGFQLLTGVKRDKWELVGFIMYKRKAGDWFRFSDNPDPFVAEIPARLMDDLDQSLAG